MWKTHAFYKMSQTRQRNAAVRARRDERSRDDAHARSIDASTRENVDAD